MRIGWIVIALGLLELPLLAASASPPRGPRGEWPKPCGYTPPGWGSGHDCNGNGVEDSVDIATGASSDVNLNGCPDECDEVTP